MNYYPDLLSTNTGLAAYHVFNQAAQNTKYTITGAFCANVFKKLAEDHDPHNAERGRAVYEEMKRRGLKVQTNNFNSLLQTCLNAKDTDNFLYYCKEFLASDATADERTHDLIFGTLYTNGFYDKVIDIYENYISTALPIRSYNQILNIYAERGDVKKAQAVFQKMIANRVAPDQISYNTAIKCAIRTDQQAWTYALYEEMKAKGIEADEVTHQLCWFQARKITQLATEESERALCKKVCARDWMPMLFKIFTASPDAQLQEWRLRGSNSVQGDPSVRLAWFKTDEMVRKLAKEKGPVTEEMVCRIHRSLGGNGTFRAKGQEVYAGGLRDLVYAPSTLVKGEMEHLIQWMNEKLKECDEGKANPIEIAARVFYQMVTIHPFNDVNGRTTRMMMDYVLLRYNILPAAMGNDVSVANFSFTPNGKTPTTATKAVRLGVSRAMTILGQNNNDQLQELQNSAV